MGSTHKNPWKKGRNYNPIYLKSFAKQVQVHISFSLNNAINRTLLLLNVLLNKSCNLYFDMVLLEHDGKPHVLHLSIHLEFGF